MKTLRDNFPKSTPSSITPRKIGLLSIPVAISMAMMYCGEKVNSILREEHQKSSELISPDFSQREKGDISESWSEAQENQVLLAYHVKKGDTLSSIARRHHVTLESILSINKKIASPDAIRIGQIILIPYDGSEEGNEAKQKTTPTESVAPITFTRSSLTQIMKNVLTRPSGTMLGAIGDQPSDIARLKVIAEKTGLGADADDVRYANLCAANMRAVSASLREYLEAQGIDIDLSWKNGKNGIGVGKYFAELNAQKQLPHGFEVIQTKSNPDPTKLKQLLLSKGAEYSIFVLSYSHDVHGHVNMAFRVGDDIIIFDPSWKGKSTGWPERFHKFEDYIAHFVDGDVTQGYQKARNRYDLFNVTCVPAHRVDDKKILVHKDVPAEKTENSNKDMGALTVVFEGFSPRMHIDTQKGNITTYSIGHGTNMGTRIGKYPYGSYAKDIAEFLEKNGHTHESIKNIMLGEKNVSHSEARGLFEMRYVTRYQKIRTHCGQKWHTYPPIIRNMLIDMSYNLNGEYGIFPNGLYPGFPDAVIALNAGDWVGFINAVADSKYAQEDVGPRRVGAWFNFIMKDLLKGNKKGLSSKSLQILGEFTSQHKVEIETLMAKSG